MRVLITGGAGFIGQAIAANLQARGHETFSIDIATETNLPESQYAYADILDFDAVRGHMHGCDAVVHMAALKAPGLDEPQNVYRINTVGTFNIYEAAAREGIKRVVQASSINAIGCHYNHGDFVPQYLPVDEDHPSVTTDAYSLSKIHGEGIGYHYWRRDGISGTGMRFPAVLRAGTFATPEFAERRATMRAFLDTFAALPADERAALLAAGYAANDDFRRVRRMMEQPYGPAHLEPPAGLDPVFWRAYSFDRFNLWTMVDERDAAEAVALAVEAEYDGFHPLFITDTHNWLGYDALTLARLFFPHVTRWTRHPEGAESLVSTRRARDLIGFIPQYPAHGATQP